MVDGHNRFRISEDWDLNYEVEELDRDIYRTRADAKQWAIDNQLARRNLTLSEIIKAQESVAKDLEAEAKERLSPGRPKKTEEKSTVNLPQINSDRKNRNPTVSEQMAKKVGVSEKTYRDARLIVNEGTPEQVRRMDEGGKGNGVSKIANEIRGKENKDKSKKILPKTKVCTKCGKEYPSDYFERNRRQCKYCRDVVKHGKLRDVKGNFIESTGEFSNVSDDEIVGTLYDASTIQITISDVIEEFSVNFNTFISNLRDILNNHKEIINENKMDVIEMWNNANDLFQALRKEYE